MTQPVSEITTSRRVGEVVRASTTEFETQCYDLYDAPSLGCLVKCGVASPVYGIVANVSTESLDPVRPPVPRGAAEESEDAVYWNNPQLKRLLATRFQSVAVGHFADGEVRRYLGPSPPRILSFVHTCDTDEVRAFSESLEFLPVLLGSPTGPQDEVIASFLGRPAALTRSRSVSLSTPAKSWPFFSPASCSD